MMSQGGVPAGAAPTSTESPENQARKWVLNREEELRIEVDKDVKISLKAKHPFFFPPFFLLKQITKLVSAIFSNK